MNVLNIFKSVNFDDSIVDEQYHTYSPRVENFNNNDEIRILIHQQDVFTLPNQSYLEIEGKFTGLPDGLESGYLTRNAFAYLFEEIRYELNGIEIDKVRDVGTTTTIKNYLSLDKSDHRNHIFGWQDKIIDHNHKFCGVIPLNKLFGFAEDYEQILTNMRQEIILLRSNINTNCFIASKDGINIEITKLVWRIQHIELNDEMKIELFNGLKLDKPIQLAFRRWELHVLPSLRTTDHDIWPVKTSTSLERPRYVIVCFQQEKYLNNRQQSITQFTNANIRNIRVHLNSKVYPYDNLNLNFTKGNYLPAYYLYSCFQKSYYNCKDREVRPYLDVNDFHKLPFFVIDVSKQNESVKFATIDLKIELEGHEAFPAKTLAYCLILYDSIFEYTPLSGIVRKVI